MVRALFAALLLLVAACGDEPAAPTFSGPPPGPSSTPATTGTTSATTAPTTTAAATTTAAVSTTTIATTTTISFAVDPADFFPDPLPGSNLAHGSGCVTGSTVLGDGIWFGFAEGYSGGTITFDLACFWTGAAAAAEATADGEEVLDFYIRNQNPKTYTVPLLQTGTAYRVVFAPDLGMEAVPASAWPVAGSFITCPAEFCSVWLYVNNGVATELVEQYLP